MHAGVVSRVISGSHEGLVTPQRSPQAGCYHHHKQRGAQAQSKSSLQPSPQAGCMAKKKRLVATLRQPPAKHSETTDTKTLMIKDEQTESQVLLTPDSQHRKMYGKSKGKAPAYKTLPPKGVLRKSLSPSVQLEMDPKAPAATMEDLSDCNEDSDDSSAPTGSTSYTKPPKTSIKVKTAKLSKQCKCCLQSQTCFLVIYLWLGLFLAGCIAAVLVISLLVVRPYMKAETFLPSQCQAVRAVYARDEWECSCGKGCASSFPCLEVVVTYLSDGGSNQTGFLREHEAALKTKVSSWLPGGGGHVPV